MADYEAVLRTATDRDVAIRVTIDLTEERLRVLAGDSEIADWGLDEVRINALADGFHVKAEGEEIILNLAEDAKFAVALGIGSAPVDLARRMSMVRDAKRTA